jgi:hypothetical protein
MPEAAALGLEGPQSFPQAKGPAFVQFLPEPGSESGTGTGAGDPRHKFPPPYQGGEKEAAQGGIIRCVDKDARLSRVAGNAPVKFPILRGNNYQTGFPYIFHSGVLPRFQIEQTVLRQHPDSFGYFGGDHRKARAEIKQNPGPAPGHRTASYKGTGGSSQIDK